MTTYVFVPYGQPFDPAPDRLVLDVGDDGEASLLDEPGPAGCGVGLTNVRARLEARYGQEARLVAGPGPLGGFLARVVLPVAPSILRSVRDN